MWFEDNVIKNNCKNFISEIQIVATKNAKQAAGFACLQPIQLRLSSEDQSSKLKT
jgi:hypothetical protein